MADSCRRVVQALSWATAILASKGIDNARLEAEVLLAHCLKWTRAKVLAEAHYCLNAEEWNVFCRIIDKRTNRFPLQYLTGHQEFMSLDFLVDERVLIPRPDTEVLVETVLARMPQTGVKAVDVGSGSGAIALSFAHFRPAWEITAADLSRDALSLTAQNAQRLGIHVDLVWGDLLSPLTGREGYFHLVASNPPYVASEEIALLAPEVGFEPHLALDGGADGLNVYRRLIPESYNVLRAGGLLALEIGSDQGEGIRCLLADGWEKVEIIPDYGGRDRVALARKA